MPTAEKGMITAPDSVAAASRTNSPLSGQNSLYSSPLKITVQGISIRHMKRRCDGADTTPNFSSAPPPGIGIVNPISTVPLFFSVGLRLPQFIIGLIQSAWEVE